MNKSKIAEAVERGKRWLLNNQITEATEAYKMFRLLTDDGSKGEWYTVPTPAHLYGAFYAGVVHDSATGKDYESLRDISTIFALRALLPLLDGRSNWARELQPTLDFAS